MEMIIFFAGIILLSVVYYGVKNHLFEVKELNIRAISLVYTGFLIIVSVFLIFSLVTINQVSFLVVISLFSLFWAFSGQRILLLIQTPLEKKFMKSQYDVETVIIQLSQTLVYMNDKHDIFQLIVSEFIRGLETKNSYYIYRDSHCENFSLIQARTNTCLVEFLPSSKVIDFFSECGDILSLEQLPYDVRCELLGMPFRPGSLFFSIHSMRDGLHGIIIIGPKFNQERFVDHDYNFLKALSNQLLVVFERISFREKLEEANRKLEKHKTELEDQVCVEVRKSTKLLESAQVLSQQAALANLTKGIAHEIKNPINNMKINVHSIRDDIEQGKYLTDCDENNTWKGAVSSVKLSTMCVSKEKGDRLFSFLLEKGYIDDSGALTTLFKPERLDFVFELPEDLVAYEESVSIYLRHTLLKKKYWLLTHILDDEFNRITRITSSMLQYGATGKGVTNTAFSEIMSFGESSLLWEELVKKGYLNSSGFIEEKFSPNKPGFTLDISAHFKLFESSIVSIILNNPYALKSTLDINSIVRDVSNICSGRFSKEYISYEEHLLEVPLILGSRDALKQCLVNIVDNSVDALLKKEKSERCLTIKTRPSVREAVNNTLVSGVLVLIEDTGCGISKESIDKIKDPFFTTKSKSGGQNAGLGMPFVYQTIGGHDGRVVIESDEGEGTKIYLYFPSV